MGLCRMPVIERDWHGLYSDSWRGEIVDEAFAHPAKFARGLIRQIYKHALEQGWMKPGDTILDPFGGVALSGLDASRFGLNWLGVELEEKFVDLGNQNIALWEFRGRGQKYNDNLPTPGKAILLQGDSRHLYSVLLSEAGAVVGSPPYSSKTVHSGTTINEDAWADGRRRKMGPSQYEDYSNNPSNLGNLPPGDFDGVVGSPPYTESLASDDPDKRGGLFKDPKRRKDKTLTAEYGESEGQIGKMPEGDFDAAIGSPPYTESLGCGRVDPAGRRKLAREMGISNAEHISPIDTESMEQREYGASPGQLGTMPPGEPPAGIVSSPPWMYSHAGHETGDYFEQVGGVGHQGLDYCKESPKESTIGGDRTSPKAKGKRQARARAVKNLSHIVVTGNQGNLVNVDTFWSAARQIMAQTYSVLRPGAVAIWVLKAFVRDKQIVDFPSQWAALGEACGFETIEWIRAWLIENRGTQYDLFGGMETKTIARKSFFRRLYESKYPKNSIDFEIVLVQRKP